MKRLMLGLLLISGSCFAANYKITKIIEDLNIYVFENTYVIRSSSMIPTKGVGSYIDFDFDLFNNYDSWDQSVSYTIKEKVGSTESNKSSWKVKGSRYNSGLQNTRRTETIDHYAWVPYVANVVFTPIGLIEKYPYCLSGFESFVAELGAVPLLRSFQSVDIDAGWINNDKEPHYTDFALLREGGSIETIEWLLEHYKSYAGDYSNSPGIQMSSEYIHEIYPIYNKHNTGFIAGVLNYSYRRKFCLHDEFYGLALFD